MSIYLFASYNLEEQASTIQIGCESSNGTTGVYTASTGSFFTFFSASIEDIDYKSALNDFTSYLSSSGFGIWNSYYDFSNSRFVLTCSSALTGANFTFNSFANKIFGFNNGTSVNQASYTSQTGSYFTFVSTEEKWSQLTYPYEKQVIVKEEECDDGRVYSISNEDGISWLSNIEGNYKHFDWQFVYEDKVNVFSDFSSSLNPNTWEQFLKSVRSYRPFVVFEPPTTSTISGSYAQRRSTNKITAEGSKFEATPSLANYDQLWNINVKTRQLSQGNNFEEYTVSTSSDFNPLTDVSGCILWLRADTGVTESTGGILNWKDQSSYQRDFYQSTSTKRPTYISSDSRFNNQASIYFASSTLDTLSASFGVVGSPWLRSFIVFAASGSTPTAIRTIAEMGNAYTSNSGSIRYAITGSSPNLKIISGMRGSTAGVNLVSSSVVFSQEQCIIADFTQNYYSLSPYELIAINNVSSSFGNLVANTYVPCTVMPSTALFYIGARAGTSLGADIVIAEMIFYASDISNEDRINIYNYLAQRYGKATIS